MTKVRGGLIQMALKAPTDKSPEEIAKAMLHAHVPLIEKAGAASVQILCIQAVFTQRFLRRFNSGTSMPRGDMT